MVLLLTGSAGASSHGSQAGATASAYGVRVVPGATSTSVSAPPNAVGFTSGFAYPGDGSVVTTGPISVSANTDVGANARSTASSSVSSFSLFGGSDKDKEKDKDKPEAADKPGMFQSLVAKVVGTLGKAIEDATRLEVRTYTSANPNAASAAGLAWLG